MNSQAKVICFEPVKRVFDKCIKQIKLNNFDIIAENRACSFSDGKKEIFDYKYEHVYAATLSDFSLSFIDRNEVVRYEVDTIALDNLCGNE